MDDRAEAGKRKRQVDRDDSLRDEEEVEMDESSGDEEEEGGEGAEEARGVSRLGESELKHPFEFRAREAAGRPENSGPGIKGDVEVKEILGIQKVAEAETHTTNSVCPTSVPVLSPVSVTESSASISSPMFPNKELSLPNMDEVLKPKPEKNGSAQIKALTVKTTVPDGYSWRKYGQKQVKSPRGSRSYFRCTYPECCSKKIERSDDFGHVIEIVNKGTHSHDAPRKISSTKESRSVSSPGPGTGGKSGRKAAETPAPDPSSSLKEPLGENTIFQERKRHSSSSTESDDYKDIQMKEDDIVGPEVKRRVKKSSLTSPYPVEKSGKKPKVIVHATGDVAISGDGYRWRKYGQKMVKGNPHPRNYYRCTSAGCPMRKQIETAVDNSNSVIITYKGDHNHVMPVPVPKKMHGPRSAPLLAAAPASMNIVQHNKTDNEEIISTQWSRGKEGEITHETVDVKGEKDKTIESAHTLLSIGFEIKQC